MTRLKLTYGHWDYTATTSAPAQRTDYILSCSISTCNLAWVCTVCTCCWQYSLLFSHTVLQQWCHHGSTVGLTMIKALKAICLLLSTAEGDTGIEVAVTTVAGSKQAAASAPAQLQQRARQTKPQAAAQLQPSTVATLSSLQPAAIATHATLQSAATGTPQSGSGSKSSKHIYTFEQLKAMTNKELVDLLRVRSCPVSGQKTELIKRLLDYQRRLKKAQTPL